MSAVTTITCHHGQLLVEQIEVDCIDRLKIRLAALILWRLASLNEVVVHRDRMRCDAVQPSAGTAAVQTSSCPRGRSCYEHQPNLISICCYLIRYRAMSAMDRLVESNQVTDSSLFYRPVQRPYVCDAHRASQHTRSVENPGQLSLLFELGQVMWIIPPGI